MWLVRTDHSAQRSESTEMVVEQPQVLCQQTANPQIVVSNRCRVEVPPQIRQQLQPLIISRNSYCTHRFEFHYPSHCVLSRWMDSLGRMFRQWLHLRKRVLLNYRRLNRNDPLHEVLAIPARLCKRRATIVIDNPERPPIERFDVVERPEQRHETAERESTEDERQQHAAEQCTARHCSAKRH